MSAKGDDQRVGFTRGAARRIGRVVRAYESGDRSTGQGGFRPGFDEFPVRLGKTTAAWDKGTLATIELYEEGAPPDEEALDPPATLADCVNKFADIGADRWVIVAQGVNGSYYLISAECGDSGSGS